MSFYKTVYQLVAQIPAGRVATYGQLALMAGNPRGARVVGYAMRRPPEGLPCHRVVFRDGSLVRNEWVPIQRELLLSEGVFFDDEGRVPLELFQWWGPEEDEME